MVISIYHCINLWVYCGIPVYVPIVTLLVSRLLFFFPDILPNLHVSLNSFCPSSVLSFPISRELCSVMFYRIQWNHVLFVLLCLACFIQVNIFIPFTLVQTTGFCFCGYVVFHCIYTMFSFLIHCDWKYLWMTGINDSSLTLGLLHRRVVRFWFHVPTMWTCWLSPSQGQASTIRLCECSCI